jgi:predicted TIM-barrel enzyme
VEYVVQNTMAQGFLGGSAAERMPIENSVFEVTQEYKKITLRQ